MTTAGRGASLLIVGNPDPVHVGAHLLSAAQSLNLPAILCDHREAFSGPLWRRKADWWLRGHRPTAMRAFSDSVVRAARERGATCVLATGITPLDANALDALGRAGVTRVNFLTDDPWNLQHRAPWFLEALPRYDYVFTPRTATLTDLVRLGGPQVAYLPFAYAPQAHFPEYAQNAEDRERFAADLMFAGGADADRVAAVTPFIAAGFRVALYGGYWNRHVATRRHARGFLSGSDLRKAIATASVALCLVRRANRDGHAMRSFEAAAMGACMLVEDTDDHRRLFGADGDAVVYFRTADEAIDRLRQLLADADWRAALSRRACEVVRQSAHTYAARLSTMLAAAERALAVT